MLLLSQQLHSLQPKSCVQFVNLVEEPFALKMPPDIPSVPPAVENAPHGSIPFASLYGTDTSPIIIDARTKVEFQEDHLPNAINVPVLLDHQRVEVGKMFNSGNLLEARLRGAQFACTNIANSLENSLLSRVLNGAKLATGTAPPPYLLVYCWRGGQRSQALATVLTATGWPGGVGCLAGGYRSWRRLLLRQLEAWPQVAMPSPLWVLAGLTGCGKTSLLKELSKVGEQVLNLESMASHKGSLFGDTHMGPDHGPSQKEFEGSLHTALKSIQPFPPRVWTECESRRIGPRCHLNSGFWKRLRGAETGLTRRIWLDVPEEARLAWILEDYASWLIDSERLDRVLESLSKYQSKKTLNHWRELVSKADFVGLVSSLLRLHYDPLYKKSRGPMITEFAKSGLLYRIEMREVSRQVIHDEVIPVLMNTVTTTSHDDQYRLSASPV